MKTVDATTTLKNAAGERLSCLEMKRLKQNELTHYFGSAPALFAAQKNHRLMQQLDTQIEEIEAFVLARCQDSEHYSLLTSTPGIGKILGMTILLETGPIDRFPNVGNYSWEPTIKRYYQRKCKKVAVMVAKKTVANKLIRVCYHMLKEGTVFDAARAFG